VKYGHLDKIWQLWFRLWESKLLNLGACYKSRNGFHCCSYVGEGVVRRVCYLCDYKECFVYGRWRRDC